MIAAGHYPGTVGQRTQREKITTQQFHLWNKRCIWTHFNEYKIKFILNVLSLIILCSETFDK